MPPAVIAAVTFAAGAGTTAIAASKSAGATKQAAQIQSTAALQGAQIQDEASKRAEAFARQQAETDYQNQERTRQANYQQWAAEQQRRGSIGSLFGLPAPNIPAYVGGVDPRYTSTNTLLPSGSAAQPGTVGAMAPSSGVTSPPTSTAGTAAAMPPGIDPRFAALYQKYGVTPGARGSGPADWQYYQNDALANAGGDVNYVLGRLEQDLQRGRGVSTPSSTTTAPGSVASYLNWKNPLSGALPMTTPLLAQPGTVGSYGIGGY